MRIGDALLAQGLIAPGQTIVHALPAGTLSVHVLEFRGSFADALRVANDVGHQSRSVSLAPGDEITLTFAAPPR